MELQDTMDKTFLIFHYIFNEQKYVEAYPIHYMPYVFAIATALPNGMAYDFVECTSRNQARKEAYKLWINPSGDGFNKMPHPRSYALK